MKIGSMPHDAASVSMSSCSEMMICGPAVVQARAPRMEEMSEKRRREARSLKKAVQSRASAAVEDGVDVDVDADADGDEDEDAGEDGDGDDDAVDFARLVRVCVCVWVCCVRRGGDDAWTSALLGMLAAGGRDDVVNGDVVVDVVAVRAASVVINDGDMDATRRGREGRGTGTLRGVVLFESRDENTSGRKLAVEDMTAMAIAIAIAMVVALLCCGTCCCCRQYRSPMINAKMCNQNKG